MNAPVLDAPPDSRVELRAVIAETIGLAAAQASIAETYAALADDAGLEHALRRFAGYSKAALATFADLRAATDGRRA